jgi:hypothetical protein
VKICSLYGAGFYYIPGTDTCIKLGGYVQLTGTSTAPRIISRHGTTAVHRLQNRASDYFTTRARTS